MTALLDDVATLKALQNSPTEKSNAAETNQATTLDTKVTK
jgi:hypothetical protein